MESCSTCLSSQCQCLHVHTAPQHTPACMSRSVDVRTKFNDNIPWYVWKRVSKWVSEWEREREPGLTLYPSDAARCSGVLPSLSQWFTTPVISTVSMVILIWTIRLRRIVGELASTAAWSDVSPSYKNTVERIQLINGNTCRILKEYWRITKNPPNY